MHPRSILRLFILCLTLMCATGSQAQNLNKFYVSSTTQDGTLYFVKPQYLRQASSTPDESKKLSYDFTYSTGKDSVRLLMTYDSRQPLRSDSVYIDGGQGYRGYALKTIYKDFRKNQWSNRIETYLPFDRWQQIFSSDRPIRVCFDPAKQRAVYTLPDKLWLQLKTTYHTFFEMVSLNH